MTPENEHHQTVTDGVEREGEVFDYLAVGRRVKADAEALFENADDVYVELLELASDPAWELAQNIIDDEQEILRSPDELIAQINGIAAVAFRLARAVRPLMESRAVHLAARADREGGRQAPTSAPESRGGGAP